MTIHEFRKALSEQFASIPGIKAYGDFQDEEIRQIEQIRQEKYITWDWNYGKSPDYNLYREIRTENGLLEIYLLASNGVLSKIRIMGDFFSLNPISELEQQLEGSLFTQDSLLKRLREIRLEKYLTCIMDTELVSQIFEQS